MNDDLKGTGIEFHTYPDCGAVLERNIILEWEKAPPRYPKKYTEYVLCALCGCDACGVYGIDVALDLLEDAGIDITEVTPGDRVEP